MIEALLQSIGHQRKLAAPKGLEVVAQHTALDRKVIKRFEPRTKPDAKEIVAAIEKALKSKLP